MPLLDRTVSVWRKVRDPKSGQFNDTQVMAATRCAIVPISRLDTQVPYAYESTHIIWVEHWLSLRKEDQIRMARHPAVDPEGDTNLPENYVISGRRRFSSGGPLQRQYYARELD